MVMLLCRYHSLSMHLDTKLGVWVGRYQETLSQADRGQDNVIVEKLVFEKFALPKTYSYFFDRVDTSKGLPGHEDHS